jgi:hydroxymethylglutaryl-CoA reductase (NADPH)
LTLIHNDYNPRNVAVRKDGRICIYDWELACYDLPQRDVFEFLSFTICGEIELSMLMKAMKYHYELMKRYAGKSYSWNDYIADFITAGESYLISRIGFYLAGSTLVNYPFIQRVFRVTLSILDHLKKHK